MNTAEAEAPNRKATPIFFDCFTTLDDLPRKKHGNPHEVLGAIMKVGGRFSVFDASANETIARTMTCIESESGWVERVEDESGYPWVTVRLTEKGHAALAASAGSVLDKQHPDRSAEDKPNGPQSRRHHVAQSFGQKTQIRQAASERATGPTPAR